MILISHRGNVNGKQPDRENNPQYILEAISKGFDVEIDVWFIEGRFLLGHDEPIYEIETSFLVNEKLWCHAKNLDALHEMLKHDNIHCFWHEEDYLTLTSKKYMWTYPGNELRDNSICVMPEIAKYNEIKCAGICSDYIENYR